MRIILISILLSIGASWTWAQPQQGFYDYDDLFNVYFPSAMTLPKGNYEIEFLADIFNSTATFNEESEEIGYTGEQDYGRTQTQLKFTKGFSERSEFRVLGRYRENNS